jgi:hypothetical protein
MKQELNWKNLADSQINKVLYCIIIAFSKIIRIRTKHRKKIFDSFLIFAQFIIGTIIDKF